MQSRVLIIVALVGLLSILAGCSVAGLGSAQNALKPEEAKAAAEKFINENLLSDGATAKINEISEDAGLYKIAVETNQKTYNWYMTKDAKKFFPQVIDEQMVSDQKKEQEQAQADKAKEDQATLANMPKSDKPKVELFVMSHCPYGTQSEKGIIPAVEALKDKVDFSVKFCDYAMHGEKEVKEQLTQYCVQKQDKSKYLAYLKCFLGDETKSDQCLKDSKVDVKALESCKTQADKEFNVMKNFKDQAGWLNGRFPVVELNKAEANKYGVSGSPSLVINGTKINSDRNPQAYLTTICNAFNEKPGECDVKLSSDNPSAGFGYAAGDSGSAEGGCGG